ncbi:MAG TPA: DUF2914 domain-containing protein [Thermoanaerobaculaceae bacterium]|nr:DUF2914 domain-containing protein [Thermoanaerobaculaceae bacterium]
MRVALSCLALFLLTATLASAQEPSATAVVCTAIENNSCEGASTVFYTSAGKLYGFSQVVNVPDKLVHVWFYKDRELGRIAMAAPKAARWKCFSNVTVARNMVGPWRLEARDSSGKVLASFNFVLQQ